MFRFVVLVFVVVSVVVSVVFVSILESVVDIGVGAHGCISVGVYVVCEHPDSINEDGIATAAWPSLATVRLPASSQDSLVGSHDKIEANSLPSPLPPMS